MDCAISHPKPLLDRRVHDLDITPSLTAMCAGYELSVWRSSQLASHIIEWLPEFALTHSELKAIGPDNAVRMIAKAASAVYDTPKYEGRGEIGEILLHIMVRQVFQSIPAISKFFYKDASNQTVKGFDCVHVVASGDSLELWLGEAKFYNDVSKAIPAVVTELDAHTKADYLRGEFAAITKKIDASWPLASRLTRLLDKNTSLDEIFDVLCIPVLLTYDSAVVQTHTKVCDQFLECFEEEVRKHWRTFSDKELPDNKRIHLFLFPMGSKDDLVKKFDDMLRRFQI